ncbi:hypothetical protein, partial [Bacillus thuringiensis]|uniref:hypothetical protein n=1 Tax=Bacillus thuringiensis TaxID=1428 RepID=UPI00366F695D
MTKYRNSPLFLPTRAQVVAINACKCRRVPAVKRQERIEVHPLQLHYLIPLWKATQQSSAMGNELLDVA